MRAIEFPKERKEKKAPLSLSSNNFEHFKNADKVVEDNDRKIGEWMSSFK